MKTLSQSRRSMASVLPKKAKWIQDAAVNINPTANEVITKLGHIISYDFLVIAVGLRLNYEKVIETTLPNGLSIKELTKIMNVLFRFLD